LGKKEKGGKNNLVMDSHAKSGKIHVAQKRKYSCCFDISKAGLDIFLSRDLQFPTMLGWANGGKDAHLSGADEKEILCLSIALATY
jgi:hypothetical protein